MKQIITTLAITSFFLVSNNVSANVISKHISTVSNPIPIERVHPKYPKEAARHGREGWVKMSYIIEKDGSVSNVLVSETSGSKDFAKAAKRAVLQWQFAPAYEDGKAIQQCANEVQMDFRMNKNGEVGVSKRFKKYYKQAQKALSDKNYKEVKKHLKTLLNLKQRHLSESDYLHLLAFHYAKAINDKELQLHHLYRVSLKTFASEQQKLYVYNEQFNLEVELNKFFSANLTYQKLVKLETAIPYQEQFDSVMLQVDEAIGSKGNIIVKANLEAKDYWHHTLVRNDFSITDVEGSLNKIDIRCANKRHIYTIEDNNTWSIPESWKSCHIYVFGEDNTQFKLVELPFQS